MLEQRLSKIDFLGRDGFHWFIGQVTTDCNWRQNSTEYGFRAKVRILGHHPATEEIPDKDLPWAHFLVPPNMGAGNNFGSQSFALQGGETVVGFFLDGEDAQQPVVLGAFTAGPHVGDVIDYKTVELKKTSAFQPIGINSSTEYGSHIKPTEEVKLNQKGGVLDNNNEIVDENGGRVVTILEKVNNEKIIVKKAQKCTIPQKILSDAIKDLKGFLEYTERLEPTPFGYVDKVFNIPVPQQDFEKVLDKVSEDISGALSVGIRVAKIEMMLEINKVVDDKLNFLEPDFLDKKLKINDKLGDFSCLFENIMGGVADVVKGMLKDLLGKMVSLPMCAAESMVAGLVSDVMDKVSLATAPTVNNITGVLNTLDNPLGAVLGSQKTPGGFSGMPNFNSVAKKALGFTQTGLKLLSCEGDECEEEADQSLNVGPDGLETPNLSRIQKLSDSLSLLPAISGIATNMFPGLDKIENPFTGISSAIEGLGTRSQERYLELQLNNDLSGIDVGCTGADGPFGKRCGPPRVQFFGGGGIGGFGKAVLGETGKIIGVSMTDMGFGFTSPPLVSFIDDCDIGRGASGKAIIEDGKIIKVVMQETGDGYLGGGLSDGTGVIPILDGVDVLNTGTGYEDGDTITTADGQTLKPIIQNGRIIGAEPLDVKDGINDLPALSINTSTGFGAVVRPTLNFVKVEDYKKPILPSTKVIQVIDCVSSY